MISFRLKEYLLNQRPLYVYRVFIANNPFYLLGLLIQEDENMRVLIKEGCKGFLFKKGKFIKMVGAGVYNTLGGKSYEVCEVNNSAIKVN